METKIPLKTAVFHLLEHLKTNSSFLCLVSNFRLLVDRLLILHPREWEFSDFINSLFFCVIQFPNV